MKKYSTLLLALLLSLTLLAQQEKKFSTFISCQFNKTVYDRTLGNNPWSVGVGLQTFYSNHSAFKPTIELTADGAVADDKIYRLNKDGSEAEDADGVINLFAGVAYNPVKKFYLSFLLGPSFINGNTRFGIKPAVGYYFSNKQKLGLRLSYTNIFNRASNYEGTKMLDFGSVSIALNIKLF